MISVITQRPWGADSPVPTDPNLPCSRGYRAVLSWGGEEEAGRRAQDFLSRRPSTPPRAICLSPHHSNRANSVPPPEREEDRQATEWTFHPAHVSSAWIKRPSSCSLDPSSETVSRVSPQTVCGQHNGGFSKTRIKQVSRHSFLHPCCMDETLLAIQGLAVISVSRGCLQSTRHWGVRDPRCEQLQEQLWKGVCPQDSNWTAVLETL